MIPITVAASLALSVLAALPAGGVVGDPLPGDVVPLEKVVIDVANVAGSGCPAGTSAVAMSPDNVSLKITFSDFIAQAGPGAKATDGRKNCQIALNVHAPAGFTYAITQIDYRGTAVLQRGASGREVASYYFHGQSQTNTASHSFIGPLADTWQTTDKTEVAAISWAPCEGSPYLDINTELRVSAGSKATSVSYMRLEELGGLSFLWKECPEPESGSAR